ncbi:MAG: DUF1499 domain-containing protein [Syntrophaceae bacterium]
MGFTGSRPHNLGVKDGALAACPDSPNCVSTQAKDARHAIAPLTYTTSREQALQRLTDIIRSLPRTRIVTSRADYLHVEFTSALFRFVDDVEFFLDDTAKTIHFRSASRLGYSDLGVNRKRMEEIRRRFQP